MTSRRADAIRAVVRGQVHWSHLRSEGIPVSRREGGWMLGPIEMEPVSIEFEDVVCGMTALLGSPAEIREWAEFVHAASDLIALRRLGAREEAVLECLMDLSAGSLESTRRLVGVE